MTRVAKKIVILEDNAERQAVMRACIADRFYTFDAHFFDRPPGPSWLRP